MGTVVVLWVHGSLVLDGFSFANRHALADAAAAALGALLVGLAEESLLRGYLGIVDPWRLIATHPTGDPLWSGGSAGPEGSLLWVPLLVASAVVMCHWWGRGRAALGLRERWHDARR